MISRVRSQWGRDEIYPDICILINQYIPAPLEFEVFFFQLKIRKNPGEKFFLPKICTNPGGKFFLHNFSGLSLFLALPHHVMGSEAILASTWVNSITKRLSGIAMWAEHLEKRSRPFQHNKWFILHPSHCLFVPALGSKPGCHWPAEPKHCLQKAKYHHAWAQASRPCSAVCKTYEKLLFNPTPCHRNA